MLHCDKHSLKARSFAGFNSADGRNMRGTPWKDWLQNIRGPKSMLPNVVKDLLRFDHSVLKLVLSLHNTLHQATPPAHTHFHHPHVANQQQGQPLPPPPPLGTTLAHTLAIQLHSTLCPAKSHKDHGSTRGVAIHGLLPRTVLAAGLLHHQSSHDRQTQCSHYRASQKMTCLSSSVPNLLLVIGTIHGKWPGLYSRCTSLPKYLAALNIHQNKIK